MRRARWREMVSPRPTELWPRASRLPRWKGSNTRSSSPAARPGPSSETMSRACAARVVVPR